MCCLCNWPCGCCVSTLIIIIIIIIASINLVLIVDLSRVCHNLFNGTLSYAFFKTINNKCNSLSVAFFFSMICVMQKMLSIHYFPARKPDCSSMKIGDLP